MNMTIKKTSSIRRRLFLLVGVGILGITALLYGHRALAESVVYGRAGNVILLGGGKTPAAVLQKFVELAGGIDSPIVVLPLASGDQVEVARYHRELFENVAKAKNVKAVFIRSKEDAMRETVVEAIRLSEGVWFTGGNQSRITERLLNTPALEAVLDVLARGGVVGGTSAGTACQGKVMLDGTGVERRVASKNLGLTPGLGLLDGVILDQHFAARQRQNRLLSAIMENPGYVGLGIDEQTAVWFKPDDTIEVMGNRVVFVYDARNAEAALVGDNPTIRGMHLSIMATGQTMQLLRHVPPQNPILDNLIQKSQSSQ